MKAMFILLSIMATNAHALSNPFCQNPTQFTCTQDQKEEASREEKIDEIENEIKTAAFEDTKRDFEIIDPTLNLKDYEEIETLSPKKLKSKVEKIFYSHVRIGFASYLKKNLMPSDLGFNSLKAKMAITINEDKELSEDRKYEFVAILNSTRLISLHSEINDNTLADTLTIFKRCSNGKFDDNAFATEIGKQKVVIVCPGQIIGSIEFIKSRQINPKYSSVPLQMTLGHELAHHFDYRYFPELYATTLSDINGQSTQFLSSPEEYMSEVTADAWGLRAAKKVLEPFSHLPIYPTLLASTVGDLCETEDDNIHPSGEFRMNYLAMKYYCD